ncbi:MAG: sigma-54 dependent transcriptional regulator [Candidatus Sumerlaeia bacterium]|nr:sigma-54 dependent transcriptional regulator [Candidatus Sumerlaeia bacterium]
MLEKTVSVLVADDDSGVRFTLGQLLKKEGYTVKEAADGDEAVAMAEREDFDVIILDVRMPRMNGLEALGRIRRIRPHTPVLIIAAHGTSAVAHQAIAAGAYDYFTKPFDNTELRIVVKRALERHMLQREIESLQQQVATLRRVQKFGTLIGGSRAMQEVYDLIQRVAPQDVTVLILGESGTGKELVAQAIVDGSPRRSMPFIKVNCAAIPETLLESELFGHERGAFTGAVLAKPGKFELANRGTIFLDEIGELSANLQVKLLRVLQEREFERVGGTKPIRVDLRVLAATNADLEQRVAEGRFREDLYFRLNVIPLTLPPLRKRLEDLPLLVEHFLALYSQQFNKDIKGVAPEVMDLFLKYPWPGNVRELENVIQRACILTQDSIIGTRWLPPEICQPQTDLHDTPLPGLYRRILPSGLFDDVSVSLSQKIEILTAQAEKELILRALAQCGHRRQAAADLLGISRKSLHNKMTRYGLLDEKAGNEGDKNV